jgi:hypothetical protein
LLALLGAVAVLALLVLRAANIRAAVAFLRNAFGVRAGAWNILCHCKILMKFIACDANDGQASSLAPNGLSEGRSHLGQSQRTEFVAG